MVKTANPYKGLYPWGPDAFSHYMATWANNHEGWAKQKAFNRRKVKRRLRQKERKEIDRWVADSEQEKRGA